MQALDHPTVRSLVALVVIGGTGVLASYWWGLAANPGSGEALWGGVPRTWRPGYTVSMLAAALGFFPFTAYVMFGLDPERVRIGSYGYAAFLVLYALILVPSALWLPLTIRMLSAPGSVPWWTIRLVLLAVAAGSLGMLWAVWVASPPSAGRSLAIAGALAFCLQTVVLDALVWPALFPR
jgi:hypothetical protein